MSERARFLAFAFANADVLIEADVEGRITFAAGALEALLCAGQSDLLGRHLHDLVGPQDRGLVRRLVRNLTPNARLRPRELQLPSPDGGVPVTLAGFRLAGSVLRNLTLTRSERPGKLARGVQDAETGLATAETFELRLGARYGVEPGPGERLTLLKLDGLAAVRSRLGAEATGRLLEEVGALLREHAVEDELAGRLADDRFGLVHGQAVTAGRIEADLAEAVRAERIDGIEAQASTVELNAPDIAVEDAGRVLLFAVRRFAEVGGTAIGDLKGGLRSLVEDTVSRVSGLRSTLLDGRVALQFQPVVTLRDRSLHHFEALSRFPAGAPGPTVAFAEQVGMAPDLDLHVCRKALDVLAANAGRVGAGIAVNMSAESLGSDLFIETFRRLSLNAGELRRSLMIEITESSSIPNLERAARVIATLRADGHRVCLDDFGAGAASFPYLQALEIDFVKIDGIYVDRLGHGARDDTILRSMIGLCHQLGAKVVAERVEEGSQAEQLASWGVELAQGYLFGRPADAPVYAPPPLAPARAARRRGTREGWG
ncbi:EAL domain-containing protein [Arenibaculum pallidiluteum]|uniref:EAL domain-containing protein n=1 Tax=Arenibaculum pallidiluteum TaxID=2812559 RepID=UPI001A97508D|nr:EAL domain-containing protein [Arenibaculum pallidiluteum]